MRMLERLGGILLAGCLAVAAFGGIKEGMTRNTVLELRGRPRASIAQENREFMEFHDGVEVELRNGRVIHVGGPAYFADTFTTEDAPDIRWTDEDVQMIRGAAEQFASTPVTWDLDETATWIALAIGGGVGLLLLVTIVATWIFFTKAGEPGWAIFVPIYNLIVMLRIAGKPAWWFWLMSIPVVNIVIAIEVDVCTARRFGKGVFFGLGLLFLPVLFYPILAFGSATYDAEA